MATKDQFAILEELVKEGPPNDRFLWPLDLATAAGRPGFGYLMPLRGNRYRGIVELMHRDVTPSFRATTITAFQLADGFWQLHASGLCYRDISFGNVFFDPERGDVLICDNDNVGIDGRSSASVRGTNGFMAPEIVRGEVIPNASTDLYSLSVLMFISS
ncbi:MAG: protein kinase domain-containing protein [Egibacteraceae bacterium]